MRFWNGVSATFDFFPASLLSARLLVRGPSPVCAHGKEDARLEKKNKN